MSHVTHHRALCIAGRERCEVEWIVSAERMVTAMHLHGTPSIFLNCYWTFPFKPSISGFIMKKEHTHWTKEWPLGEDLTLILIHRMILCTALATCSVTVPQLFRWTQDWTHLQCDWVLSKVPLLPFLKAAATNYHFGTSCFRKLRLQWNTIALMRSTLGISKRRREETFLFWSEGQERMKLSNTFALLRELKCWA